MRSGPGGVTPEPAPSAAAALHEALLTLGVDVLFGMDAPAALHAQLTDSSIRTIAARDERGAAFMADGYAKVSGKPGVLGVGGVGATNAVQGVIEAFLGSTPLVLLVEEGSAATRHRNDLQDIDRGPIFASITKWVAQIEHPDRVADLTAAAFRIAASGRPGPVYLGCPWDVVSNEPRPTPTLTVAPPPPPRVAPDPDAVERAAEAIAGAARPAIVAGGGVRIAGAEAELMALARRLGAPVATTPAGKGAVDEFDPLSLGVVGAYTGGIGGRGRAAGATVQAADVVILVGTGTGSGATAGWTVPDPEQTIVHLDIDPREPGRNYPGTIPIVADARLGLDALAAAVGEPTRTPWADPVGAGELPVSSDPGDDQPIDPAWLLPSLQDALTDDTVVVPDAGYCAAWALEGLRFRVPGRRFIAPGAYGTLGYGLPAAIGVKVAAPASPVICLTGDGGLGFSLAELETAARCRTPVTVVVFNNSALAWSRQYDRHFYGYEGDTALLDADHAAVARALGCEGVTVTRTDDFGSALAEALASSSPTLIDVITDAAARPPVDMFD